MGWCFLEGSKIGTKIAPRVNMIILAHKDTRLLFKLSFIPNVIFFETRGLIDI